MQREGKDNEMERKAKGQREGVSEREGEMAVSDLTVIHNSRTGCYKEYEQCCRRDEKVTRYNDKMLQLCLKVTVGISDRDDVKWLRFLDLL